MQVLEAPASDVGFLVHQTGRVADHLKEALLLALVQVLVQEIVSGGKPNQGVRQGNFIPRGVFDKPAMRDDKIKLRVRHQTHAEHMDENKNSAVSKREV